MNRRSYTEDEWMGLEPVYSPAIRDDQNEFDWAEFEKQQGLEEVALYRSKALTEAEYYRTHSKHYVYCSCGRVADSVYLPNDAEDVEGMLGNMRVHKTCWLHTERKK